MTSGTNEQPNVVLVVADTARAKNFSLYGYSRSTSPNLNRIAEEATVYRNAISTAPWTVPSHASMFTGMYTSSHGCTRSSPSISADLTTLPELLRLAEYGTYCITANTLLTADNGLNTGFDRSFVTTRPFPNDTDYSQIKSVFNDHGLDGRSFSAFFDLLRSDGSIKDCVNLGDKFVRQQLRRKFDKSRYVEQKGSQNNLQVFEEIVSAESEPFFVYLNFMETHLQYLPPRRFRAPFVSEDIDESELWDVNQDPRLYNYANAVEMNSSDFELLESLYDGAVRYTDELIGQLYNSLDESGLLDDTLFIVVGDHGENVGEYGRMGHSLALNDALLRVPLVVSYPNTRSGIAIDELVQTHDIFDTVFETCGLTDHKSGGKLGADSRLLPRTPDERGREYAIAEYLGSPFSGIKRIMEQYPDVEYEQYDYEVKAIYANDATKFTIRSTDEERLNTVGIDGERPFDGEDSDAVADQLRTELFDCVEPFGKTRMTDDIERNLEETLRDLGYI